MQNFKSKYWLQRPRELHKYYVPKLHLKLDEQKFAYMAGNLPKSCEFNKELESEYHSSTNAFLPL